jgi:hypothetical protein
MGLYSIQCFFRMLAFYHYMHHFCDPPLDIIRYAQRRARKQLKVNH